MLILFHIAVLCHFIFGVYYTFAFIEENDIKHRKFEFAGAFVYLTNITFVSSGELHQVKVINFFIKNI